MHEAVKRELRKFRSDHLPEDLAEVSRQFEPVAQWVAGFLEGTEVTYCLRSLLHAKDCAVRARVEMREQELCRDDSTPT